MRCTLRKICFRIGDTGGYTGCNARWGGYLLTGLWDWLKGITALVKGYFTRLPLKSYLGIKEGLYITISTSPGVFSALSGVNIC